MAQPAALADPPCVTVPVYPGAQIVQAETDTWPVSGDVEMPEGQALAQAARQGLTIEPHEK
jgi:hypothetical protein